jgi:hypothetical protein
VAVYYKAWLRRKDKEDQKPKTQILAAMCGHVSEVLGRKTKVKYDDRRANHRHLRERRRDPGHSRTQRGLDFEPRSKPRLVAMIERSFAKGGD